MREKALPIGCIQCRTWVHFRKTCANLSYRETKKKWKNYKCPRSQQKTKKIQTLASYLLLITSYYFQPFCVPECSPN